ncbi:Membrane protein EccB4, component of Type VII secretion system ESX-4 [Leifsonia rubra CMS 76R]|nr:Membrane protein EccB4, component of Type VII secretion system ESX-4 [Leifsonia rubra CMS 76R]
MILTTLTSTASTGSFPWLAGSFRRLAGTVTREVPVAPDSDQATEWLLSELSKAPYQAAKPTLFDRISKAFSDWLESLTVGGGNTIPTLVLVVLIALVAIAIIAAIVVYGLPRLNRKSRHEQILFGETDYRTAAQLREAAEKAAASEDFASAIADMFRSIARGLSERTLVAMTPGTTAHGFAAQASRALPECAAELASSADIFDRVRYMRKPATRAQYDELRAVELSVRAAKPILDEATL